MNLMAGTVLFMLINNFFFSQFHWLYFISIVMIGIGLIAYSVYPPATAGDYRKCKITAPGDEKRTLDDLENGSVYLTTSSFISERSVSADSYRNMPTADETVTNSQQTVSPAAKAADSGTIHISGDSSMDQTRL